MKVQRIRLGPARYTYLLIGEDMLPVDDVNRYLKYLSNIQKSPNTIHTYCTALKFFYEFMEESGLHIGELRLYELSNYIIWLSDYEGRENITYFDPKSGIRGAKTINLYLTVVTGYLRFMYQSNFLTYNPDDVLFQIVSNAKNPYKEFLFHISKEKLGYRNILKLKETKEKPKRLASSEVEQLVKATTNIRDEFLLRLLSTTGIRIGEALGIKHEDIQSCSSGEYKLKISNRQNNVNQSRSKSGERDIFIPRELLDLYDDYCYFLELTQGIISDYVLVKLRGLNRGKPMNSYDVNHLFRTLKQKTGINIHPHLFRSTYGSVSYEITNDVEYVRETLGHKQIQTTVKSYVFPSEEAMLNNWKKVQRKIGESNEATITNNSKKS